MLCVPSSLNELLVLFESCFTRPTFETFRGVLVGQVSQTSLRCVTGMLTGSRLSGVWHHARCHRFFANARWSVDELGLRLACLIVERFTEPGASVLVAVDDTLLKRRGRRIHGTFWHHDATANSRSGSVAWGNNWIVAGICVKLPFLQRTVCLPVLFRLWQPRREQFVKQHKPDPERPGKVKLARAMVCLLAKRLPDRQINVVGDSAYISQAWRAAPKRVTITSRLRSNAVIYAPAPPRTGKRGRPRKWGKQLESVQQIAADPATEWVKTTVRRYSKTETLELAEINCLWEPLGAETPVRVILVKDDTKPCGYQIALITTDLHATAAQIVERYADRWPIEVAFQDGKELFGVGDARNRTEKAVQRTVPFQFLAMDLTIIWYALYGHHPDIVTEHRARAPWYVSKTTPSFQDMLAKLRRVIIATQFQPEQARTPTTQEINQVQQAWAAAGL
ncbi:transposase [Conexibacter sp. S30A1]|uniref:IS701 family transposase n=1 Tax=Conexibacter sp. S30A1 TaxID=2937800 RepID=UPI00200F794A|nr:transposase [Conexibacter sp. S30A1]